MSTPEQGDEPVFANVSELLFSVVRQASELDVEADRRLQERDAAASQDALREQAHLIQTLPETLATFKARGGLVPAEVQEVALDLSAMATRHLETDNLFGMAVLLTPLGEGKVEEPNVLEGLAMRYQPSPEA